MPHPTFSAAQLAPLVPNAADHAFADETTELFTTLHRTFRDLCDAAPETRHAPSCALSADSATFRFDPAGLRADLSAHERAALTTRAHAASAVITRLQALFAPDDGPVRVCPSLSSDGWHKQVSHYIRIAGAAVRASGSARHQIKLITSMGDRDEVHGRLLRYRAARRDSPLFTPPSDDALLWTVRVLRRGMDWRDKTEEIDYLVHADDPRGALTHAVVAAFDDIRILRDDPGRCTITPCSVALDPSALATLATDLPLSRPRAPG